VAGGAPRHRCSWRAVSLVALQGFTEPDPRNRCTRTLALLRDGVTLSLKSSTGPFSEPKEEKSIRKQQICDTRKKPTASIARDSRLLSRPRPLVPSAVTASRPAFFPFQMLMQYLYYGGTESMEIPTTDILEVRMFSSKSHQACWGINRARKAKSRS